MRTTKLRELLLLSLWLLLLGPILSQLVIGSFGELPPSGSLELGTIALSSLIIFALPSLFFPIGKEARQALFKPVPRPEGWHVSRWRLLAIGVGSLLLAEGAYLLVLHLGELLGIQGKDHITEHVRQILSSGQISPLWAWLTLAVIPTVSEELSFRGMIQPLLTCLLSGSTKRYIPWLLTALFFSLLHFSLLGLVSRFILGYALSFLATETSRLRAPILLHLANNTLALLVLYP